MPSSKSSKRNSSSSSTTTNTTTNNTTDDRDYDDNDLYTQARTYQTDDAHDDYYTILGLPRPGPNGSNTITDHDIRAAYRTLTFSFHPDKQPAHLREAAQRHFERIHEAYETLVDARKRAVYDLVGSEGVKREWRGGVGPGDGPGDGAVGVRAKSPEEFRKWFLDLMRRRERGVVNAMVQSRGSITLGIDADMIELSEEGTEFFLRVPSLQPVSYAIGYSFKAPFPTPAGILGKMVDETADDDDDDEPEKDEPGTEVGINASISGEIEHLFQEAQVQYEDGWEDKTEIPLRPSLTASQINLAATVSRVIGDAGGTKSLLGLPPFSLLRNSGLTLNAHVLPFPFVTTSVTKAVTPISGTNPFKVVLTNTYMNWPHMTPPSFALATSKQIGQRKHAFCSWSSGSLTWPGPVYRLLNPGDSIGLKAGIAMAAFQQPSSFSVGVISEPEENVVSVDEEDEDADEDETEGQGQQQKHHQGKAESWQVQFQASPAQGAVSFNYGRNVFSGKPIEPARSEWSSEGYHGVPRTPETRAVRVELTTTVTLGLSLAFNVEAVRQVGEFTRMGLGVGLQGAQGIAMTVSWSRLGQKIRLPITICSLENVNWDVFTAALVLPWATYCAVEFGYLRPRERKKRRRLIAKKQRRLRGLIPQKKSESALAVQLMTEQVQRRQAKETAQNGLAIVRAEYGYLSSSPKRVKGYDPKDYEVIDVTVPVAALVDRSQLVISDGTVKFQLLGFHDPAPLLPKTLRIWYRYHGRDHFVQVHDPDGVSCPMRTHLQ